MATPLRNLRADDDTWSGAQAALDALDAPRRVSVTLRPGMNRTTAIVAFLRALTRTPSSAARADAP